ncbi:MAG: transglutaminase domain-containing protein [Lachnospiraceae bacterium]|nr:transglutaminase domain-containing protein [Lachnospiraceae bacterium]MDY5496556.1 transglutaminase domain-containing protein [Anaerobutyricum sp.]
MKRHTRLTGLILLCFLAIVVPFAGAHAEEKAETEPTVTEEKSGLVRENGKYHLYSDGKLIKKSWQTVDNARYYFDNKGNAVVGSNKIGKTVYIFKQNGKLFCPKKARFTKVNNSYYLADRNGKAVKGWQVVDKKLYYMNKNGMMIKDRKIENIRLGADGSAKKSSRTKLKIKVINIVNDITTEKMSKRQKLRACWNYCVSHSRFRYSSAKYPNLRKSGWYRDTAYDMLTTRRGNCYSFACAFAALADQVGYDCKVVCGRVSGSRDHASDGLTRHAWVQINGRNYDPEGEFAGWKRGVYGLGSYSIRHTVQKKVTFKY